MTGHRDHEERYVYDFDEPCEGGRDLLGGKGLGLAEMTQLGLPIPRGFTITTAACRARCSTTSTSRTGSTRRSTRTSLGSRRVTGKRLGDPERPLLLSVRSGGPDLDARDDGDDPEPRAQQPSSQPRSPRGPGTRTSRTTPTAG